VRAVAIQRQLTNNRPPHTHYNIYTTLGEGFGVNKYNNFIFITMDEQLHLPWDRPSLEKILREIIPLGETTKVDLKSTFDLSTIQSQSELLKDVSALANTYSHDYKNHGFIIFGAEPENIVYTNFQDNEDHLQANIDDLITKYIEPFIKTHLYIFSNQNKKWGVLVVPPTRTAPHVFINEIHKRYRGDIYVRNGSITRKALAGDYARFFRQHLEEHTYEFQEAVNNLQKEVLKINKKINKLTTSNNERTPAPKIKIKKIDAVIEENVTPISEIIENLLAKEEDDISRGLMAEVSKINDFLESETIPWNIVTSDKKLSQEIISNIESISGEFWSAIINLVLRDEEEKYNDTLVQAITYMAKQFEAPSGVSYTDVGKNIRYYALFVSLYLITIVGVSKRRNKLLRNIFKIELRGKSNYDEPMSILYVLFFIRRAELIFHPFHTNYPQQRWCDPVASFTKSLIDKFLNPNEFLWNKEREYFRGEFILCISPMDIVDQDTKNPMIEHPSAGLYLLYSSAIPIITKFLKEDHGWIQKLFTRPLGDLLKEFDETASKLGRASNCFSDGFQYGALEAISQKNKPPLEKS